MLLFGIEYIKATFILKILSTGYLFKVLSKPLEALYNEIKGNPLIISKANAFGFFVLIISMFLGSKYYGLTGAALGTAITMLISYLVIFIYHLKNNRTNFLDYYNLENLYNSIMLIFRK